VSGPANLSRTEKADPRGLMSGIPAPRVGEYTLSSGGAESRIGASLLSLAETSLASVNEVEFGDRISVAADTAAPKSDRALWWMLACVGFAVLLLEWWWFQRRPF
jgi:Ca-activated chloride channel homolog